MSHILHGDLVLYALHPYAVAERRRAEIAAHLARCAACQDIADFFSISEEGLADELAEPDTWEPQIGTATRTALMEYGARVTQEDADAELVLKPFIENPITAAWTTIGTKRQHRTGGVVRTLCAAAHRVCQSKPRVALTFAETAITVAEALPDDLYPARAVELLRGTAWKERANAQMLLGEFPEALRSLDRAERAYMKTPHNGLGLSIVALVRAGVLYAQLRTNEALEVAERAERGFSHAGDEKRRMDAAFLRASILFEGGDPTAALPVFHRIIEHGENTQSAQWIALGSYAAGNCEVDRGNLGEASVLFHRAIVIFRAVGPDRERLLTEWGMARVLLHSGKLHQAIRRLKDIAAEFEERGMATYAAYVGLDIADALLALQQWREIVTRAQHMFSVFKAAGMLTGALAAVAYLKEAAATKRLTQQDVAEIRAFLRRSELQPSLAFVRPAARP